VQVTKVKVASGCEFARARAVPDNSSPDKTLTTQKRTRCGIAEHEGEDFDPRRQRSVSTVPADDPERNKTIAGRLRPGFQAGEKLIRPEIVSVHILK